MPEGQALPYTRTGLRDEKINVYSRLADRTAAGIVKIQTGHQRLGQYANAGVAQLVERNLAKVEVASSRLVSRSRFRSAVQRPLKACTIAVFGEQP